jgi:signal transduction histidine kinase
MVLQKRISLALTAVIAIFVTAQGYLAYKSLEKQEDALVDEILQTETERLIERLQAGEVVLEPTTQPLRLGPNLRAWLVPSTTRDAAGPIDTSSVRNAEIAAGTGGLVPPPAHLVGLPHGAHHLHDGERIYHAIVGPVADGRLFVEFEATQNEQFVYEFGRIVLLTGLLCILLGWLISSSLARVVVAPFRRMSERLNNWSSGTLPAPATRSDEEALLLQAFDAAQRRLEESLVREREFAANARHEVRTPLAALRTDAEMILLTETLSKTSEKRLQRMMAAVDQVSSGLDSLHALSSEAPAQVEAVMLAQCVDEVWESLSHLADGAGTTLANEVPRGEVVNVDRLALVTVLRNLLRNVIDHASPGSCSVRCIQNGIAVADEGPGIAPEHRALVFDRYFQGRLTDSPGTAKHDKGLGLAIAKQTADLRGWHLELDSTGPRGTVFSLRFGCGSSNPESRRNHRPGSDAMRPIILRDRN